MKQTFKQIRPCPCGSKRSLQACCGPLLTAAYPAPTAEALMRSRYTANALDMQEYLLRTWHPSTRPTELMPTAGLRWVGLTIHRTDAGGSDEHSGTVEFTAHFRERGRPGALHETSRFIREREQWFYLDGDIH